MTERTGTTIDVDLRVREVQIVHRCHGHDCKRLIDFPKVNVADLPADSMEQLGDGLAGFGNVCAGLFPVYAVPAKSQSIVVAFTLLSNAMLSEPIHTSVIENFARAGS